MDQSAAQPLPDRPKTVTTADLLATHLQGPKVREVGTRTLTVGDVPVALVSTDVTRLNPITATSSTGMSALEMIAALAGHDPTGVMVIEDAMGLHGAAFNVQHGRVTGARGRDEQGDLKAWAKTLHARFPARVTTPPPGETASPGPEWVGLAKDFVRELALEALGTTTTPGARITFLRGDVTWQGPSLPQDGGLGLQHLLLEHARREDELPRMLAKLGDLDQIALPMFEPGPMPPGGKPTATGKMDETDSWGDAQPDDASKSAWSFARALYPLCDGQRSLDELADYSMFGRFQALEALILLAKGQNIVVVESPNKVAPGVPTVIELPPTPRVPVQPAPPVPEPETSPDRPTTGYMLQRRATERVDLPTERRTKPKPRLKSTPKPAKPVARTVARPQPTPERIPTRERVEAHADVVTAKPPSVRNANVGGGQTLLDALEAELAALDTKPPAPAPRGPAINYVLLAIVGSLLFAGGAAFSMMLG